MAADKVLYIHIPTDILEENSPYRCPTTVNLELREHAGSRKRSVGAYPAVLTSRTTDSCSTIVSSQPGPNSVQHGSIATPHGHTPVAFLRGKGIATAQSVVSQQTKQVSGSRTSRTMESGETEHHDSTETSDGIDLIEAVAQANDALEFPAALPRLQSSPCPIHTRSYQQQHHLPMYRQQQLQQRNYNSMEPRNDLLYSTNCHGGQVRRSSSQASGHSGRRSNKSGNSGEIRRQEEERVQMEREKTFKQDVLAGRSQKYSRPVLPNELASEDFVSTWIMHGSQPNGLSHFPDLIPDQAEESNSILPVPADTNRGKRQTLRPIKTLGGEYAKGLRGNSIHISDTRPK